MNRDSNEELMRKLTKQIPNSYDENENITTSNSEKINVGALLLYLYANPKNDDNQAPQSILNNALEDGGHRELLQKIESLVNNVPYHQEIDEHTEWLQVIAEMRQNPDLAQTLESLLRQSFNVRVKYKNNKTILYYALRKKASEKLIHYFLNEGADPNAQNHIGWIPLHIASFNARKDPSIKNIRIIGLLLYFGANPKLANFKNHTSKDCIHSEGKLDNNKMKNIVENLKDFTDEERLQLIAAMFENPSLANDLFK